MRKKREGVGFPNVPFTACNNSGKGESRSMAAIRRVTRTILRFRCDILSATYRDQRTYNLQPTTGTHKTISTTDPTRTIAQLDFLQPQSNIAHGSQSAPRLESSMVLMGQAATDPRVTSAADASNPRPDILMILLNSFFLSIVGLVHW